MTFYPWSAVCSLHFTLSLHFTPGLQSAVCSLRFTLTACTTESWTIEAVVGTWADTTVDVDAALVDVVTDGGGRSASWTAFWTARERALDSAVTFTCIVPSC